MKARFIFVAVIMSLSMLAACTKNEEPVTDNEDARTAVQTEETVKEPETEEEFHAAMTERSLYSLGNTERLKKVIEKCRSGETVTAAYIGGSITEGLTAGSERCYARLSSQYLAEHFGTGDNVICVNKGLSGTPSNLGVLRLERDVLSQSPDIVFVEFAVNDGQDKIAKESYESLVRTALESESKPAVVLLFNVIKSGYTAQAHMKEIGEHYDIPMISAADALTPEFEEGRLKWEDYSDDESHPNVWGHELLCEFIGNLFTKADEAKEGEQYSVPAGSRFGSPYENAKLITPEAPEAEGISLSDTGAFVPKDGGAAGFPTSWKYDGEGTDPLKFTVNANAVFVIYKRNNSSSFGSVDVYLNGEKLKTVDTNQSDGWGEAFSEQIIKYQGVKELEIELRPTEESKGKQIDILGIAYSQNVTF